ncbi:MAG: hypothetical protein M1821_008646 [Bathelium mastoideum]|nr:MAG: hypothetical protein M1821_008646 [Bathelium mastoideum]
MDRALSRLSFHRSNKDSNSRPSSVREDDFKGPLGLNILYEPQQPRADIVFIHGLGGGSRKTWCRTPDPSHYWPKEWLPLDQSFEHIRIHSFGYNADWGENRDSVLDINDFGHSLLGELHNTPALRKGATRIVLVGHSMGGIVIKKAYILARQDPAFSDLAKRFHSFYFLATPHRGSDLARTLTNILRVTFGQKPYVNDLERNSGTIAVINDTFRHYANDVNLWSFYETVPSNLKVLNAMVVDKSSATLGYNNEQIMPLNADHRGVCKFTDSTDPTYITIRNALCIAVDSIVAETTAAEMQLARHDRQRLEYFLSSPDVPEDDLSIFSESRLSESCTWLTQRTDYVDWEASWSGVPPVLWFTGNPATGKSVLCSHVIETLKGRTPAISYFFFKHGVLGRQTIGACLRSLAYQIALRSNSLSRKMLGLADDDVSWDHEDERAIWRKLFVNVIFRHNTAELQYWVIDGLDEAFKPEQLIRWIPTFPQTLRVFITSRNTQEIQNAVSGVSRFVAYREISPLDTMHDIRSLVTSRMEILPIGSNEILMDQIMSKSAGCFLWVRLVLEELEHCYTEEAVEETLQDIPSDMNALYSRMLGLIPRSNRSIKLAKSILSWVVCAARPLTLEEMRSAVKLDLNETANNLERSIGSICGQFVTVDPFKRVQAIHQTAIDFLGQQSINPEFAIDKKACHTRISMLLLHCLASDALKVSGYTPIRHSSNQGASGNPGLINYAMQHFSYHLNRCRSSEDDVMRNLIIFLRTNILSWIEGVSKDGDLSPITQTAADLRTYLCRRERHVPPLHADMQTADAWTTDLIRIAGKFRKYLLNVSHPHRTLEVRGSLAQEWDDCLARIDFTSGQALAVAHGESLFAVGLSDGFISIHSRTTIQPKYKFNHGERVKILTFDKEDQNLASGGACKLSLWDVKSYTLRWSMKLDCQVLTLHFMGNEFLLGATQRHEIVSWNVQNPQNERSTWLHGFADLALAQRPTQPPTKALFSSDHRFLAVAYRGHGLFLIDLETAGILSRLTRDDESDSNNSMVHYGVDALAFNPNPDFDLLIASYGDGELVVYDLHSYEACYRVDAVYAHSLACSPDGRSLITGSSSGTIQIFDFDGVHGQSITLVYRINAYEDGIRGITFSKESSRFLDVRAAQCRVWEPPALIRKDGSEESLSEMTQPLPARPKTVGMLEGPPQPEITALLSLSDGTNVVCGKQDGSLLLCSTTDTTQVTNLNGHQTNVSVTCIALTYDDTTVVSADESGRILVQKRVDDHNYSRIPELLADRRFSSAVLALLVNHDGSHLLVSGVDCVELWTLPDGKELTQRRFNNRRSLNAVRHPIHQDMLIVFDDDVARLLRWSNLEELSVPMGIRLEQSLHPNSKETNTIVSYKGVSILIQLVKVFGRRAQTRFECWQASELEISTTSTAALSGFKLLGPSVEYVIAVVGTTLLFLDTDLWICSLDLKTFGTTPVAKRHFFVLSEWFTASGELLYQFTTKKEFVFAKKHEVIVVKHGLDFAETLELSSSTRAWNLSRGSMHRRISHTSHR